MISYPQTVYLLHPLLDPLLPQAPTLGVRLPSLMNSFRRSHSPTILSPTSTWRRTNLHSRPNTSIVRYTLLALFVLYSIQIPFSTFSVALPHSFILVSDQLLMGADSAIIMASSTFYLAFLHHSSSFYP